MKARWLHHYLVLALELGYAVPQLYKTWSLHPSLRLLCKFTAQDQVDYVQLALQTSVTRFEAGNTIYKFDNYYQPGYQLTARVFSRCVRWDAYTPPKYGMWIIENDMRAHAASGYTSKRWDYEAEHCTVLLNDIITLFKA
jgi:hypothetical protein